jgi:deoxyribodipyrimidine photolyase-like uncharacterized protein
MRHYAEHLRMEGFRVDYRKAPNFMFGLRLHKSECPLGAALRMTSSTYQGIEFQNQRAERLDIAFEVVQISKFQLGQFNPTLF